MGFPRLIRVTWLQNHGVQVAYRGEPVRFVGPDGDLLVSEAARALGTYSLLLRRMIKHRRMEANKVAGVLRVPMAEVLRLRRAWRTTGRPTGRIEQGRVTA
jgi:hypothetical protein